MNSSGRLDWLQPQSLGDSVIGLDFVEYVLLNACCERSFITPYFEYELLFCYTIIETSP